jgi:hypothetical protein
MWKQTVIVIALVASISLSVTAQDKGSHLEAARSFMRSLGMKEKMIQSFKPLVKESNVFQGIDWSELETRLATVYTKSLTEAELRKMTAFFKTPTGRKYAAMSQTLPKDLKEVQSQFFMEQMAKTLKGGARDLPVSSIDQMMKDLKRQDEKAAMFGIGVLRSLEANDLANAKKGLVIAIGSYYMRYLNRDASKLKGINLTAKKSIEALMQKSDVLRRYIVDRQKK